VPNRSDLTRPLRRGRAALAVGLSVATVAASLLVAGAEHAGASVPRPQPGWTTVFSDDFKGRANTGLNTTDWLYDIGTSYPGGASNWGTGEVETATNSTANVYQDGNGHLVIKPIRDASGNWTSGRVETQRTDFAAPPGGELEITASIRQPNPASGLGYWPAFWALGAAARPVGATNWPSVGEFDVMEDVNALSEVSHTFHCGSWGQPPCNEPDGISSGLLACPGCQTAYHTYTAIVDRTTPGSEQLRFFTDGTLQFTVNQNQVDATTWTNAVDHGFFMILDVAIGGSYPNKVCGCNSTANPPSSGAGMSVDYVAVYEKAATTTSTGSTTPTSTTPTSTTPTSTTPTSTTPTSTAPTSTTPTSTTPTSTTPTSTTPTSTAPTCSAPTGSPVSATSTIQAESDNAQAGAQTETTLDTGGGQDVGPIGNDAWLQYSNVDFGSTPLTQFKARGASGAASGVSGLVEVHLDSLSNPSIGSFAIANTGGWQNWITVPANITGTTGTHTVYLKFVTGSGQDFVSINWFTFSQ